MRKLTVFNFITLNGFYKGMYEDISWHQHSEDENEFGNNAIQQDNILVFGRTTYEMMARYWSSPQAMEMNPTMAEAMNKAEKIVFSRTLDKVTWHNSTLIKDDMVNVMKRLKQIPGKDMTILGSGNIITQFAEAEIIDQYQLMINPIALGDGVPLFDRLINPIKFNLVSHHVFKSGVILLTYEPIKKNIL